MTAFDFLKAVLVGALVLTLNLLTLVILVFSYSQFIHPGQTEAFYTQAAPRLGAWFGPIVGALLMFLAVWLLGLRRRGRNAYAFAAATFTSYLLLDTALGLVVSSPSELFRPAFALSMLGVGVAAFVGAYVSTRARQPRSS